MEPLPPLLDASVERHWLAAQRGRRLFNGRVFCADAVTPDLISGHWTEYRRVVAQMADPRLIPALQVRSLAVCGVLCCQGGVVVGRRDGASVYQAGLWQLPPAGSVDDGSAQGDTADIRHALLTELQEELGIPAGAVDAVRPLCLVQHPTGVLDLGMQITTRLTAADVLAAHRAAGNREYDRLLVMPAAEIQNRLATLDGQLVPPARAFLRRLL